MDKKRSLFFLTVIVLCFLFSATASYALDAYIDMKSGIIIGRGEAEMQRVDSYQSARGVAVEKAKSEIRKVLERQPVDPASIDTRTIAEFLDDNPGKTRIFSNFINSAKLIMHKKNESGNSVIVTLQLLVEGPGGYKEMLARLTGSKFADADNSFAAGGELDNNVRAELADRIAGRSPDELTKPYEIVIPDFLNFTEFGDADIGPLMTGEIVSRFQRDHRFSFISGDAAEEMLDKNDKSFDDIWNADITKIMKLKGIDGVVVGAITKYESITKKHGIAETGFLEMSFNIEVDLRVLDARNGRWSFYEKIPVQLSENNFSLKSTDTPAEVVDSNNLNNPDALAARAFQAIVTKIEDKIRIAFPLEGYILKVSGDRIYVNLTRADGLKNGDVLNVYRIGDMLIDPVTGQEIDRIRDRIGSIEVVEAKETYSQAVTKELPLADIAAGDIVTLN